MVGALLLIMGLSLSNPEKIDAPIAKAKSDTTGSATKSMAAKAPALEDIEGIEGIAGIKQIQWIDRKRYQEPQIRPSLPWARIFG